MSVLLGQADWPVGLLLPLTTGKCVGVELGNPATLTRAARTIEQREETVRIVDDGDLGEHT